ncbi:MAG: CBS domain-containing protein [Oceanospirillaceae bacterium]|nr:CBS domain-containing protein [Oceanospirillaceae bacterium]
MTEDRPEKPRSIFGRIAQALSFDPKTKQEVLDVIEEAVEDNLLDSEALSIIKGAMQVADLQVRDIMVPRSKMVVVEADQTLKEFLPTIISSAHSRFPVIGKSPDEIIGVLLAKDLLPNLLDKNETEFTVQDKLRKVTFIPESKRLNILLKEFRATRSHLAIVVDEYGGIAGLITIEDVLEQIVGEIEDEHDAIDDDGNIRPFDDNAYLVKALTELEDFDEYFGTKFNSYQFNTVGGIVTKRFGHLPQKDEEIEIDGFKFKVLSSENRRIRLLQVERMVT